MKIDESNFSTIKTVSDKTGTEYDIKWYDAENIDGYVETETILCMFEDLIYEIDKLEERLDDLIEDIRDNYKKVPVSEQVDISDRDFI